MSTRNEDVVHKRRSLAIERPNSFVRTFASEESKLRRSLIRVLDESISNSGKILDGSESEPVNSSMARTATPDWLSKLFSDSQDLTDEFFAKEDMGNYVIDRQTRQKEWEAMPLYERIGLHLLFHGPCAIKFVTWLEIRKILKEESIKEGKIYDSTDPKLVLHQIKSFISLYGISLDELLEPDITKYPTFNSFFSRSLRPNARLPAFPDDLSIIGSAADSRLTVFNSVNEATKFWIKGKKFSISTLLQNETLTASLGARPRLAIWRLAPQDYHRFHSPINGKFKHVDHIPGDYYTVNPQAVNENLDVFTANTRSVATFDITFSSDKRRTLPCAFVAVGALLVGSIRWIKNPGDDLTRGEQLGYFQYGGSTVIGVFPEEAQIEWDNDLAEASRASLEVLVKAGEKIGRAEIKI